MKYFLLLFVYLTLVSHVFAYSLPYPSYMPGHKFYAISRIVDRAKAWWYWGSRGSIKYHSLLADKYLVEAKTLFEYQQYLLALDALKRSNEHVLLLSSRNPEQMKAHVETLERLKEILPKEFLWQPEKREPTHLPIADLLEEALFLRIHDQ